MKTMKTFKVLKNGGPQTHILQREDFTDAAIDLGIWEGLTEEHGVSADAMEIEVMVTTVKEVK